MQATLRSAQRGHTSVRAALFSSEVVVLPGGGRLGREGHLSRALAQFSRAAWQHRQKRAFTSRLPRALPSRENPAKELGWPSLPPQASPRVCTRGRGAELLRLTDLWLFASWPAAFTSLGRFAEGADHLLHCRCQALLRKTMSENDG